MPQADFLPAPSFEPTLAAAHAHLRAVCPGAYARTRNHLDGAVTRLSPYITHGFISVSAQATHNPGYQAFLVDHAPHLAAPARFFPEPVRLCPSFSRFWHSISPKIADFDAHVLRQAP